MNARTALLLGIMTLVVGAWVADQFGMLAFFDGSGSQHETELDKVSRQISKAEDIIQLGIRADEHLSVLEQRSLPYDPAGARSAYQSWLTNLVEDNAIEKSTVEVSTPEIVTVKDGDRKTKEAYKRYGFTLTGIGRLNDVTRFLFSFYQAGHLHKITSLTLTPSGEDAFNISLAGEALGISTCERKSKLTSVARQSCVFQSVDDYAPIVRRNIFSKEGGKALKFVTLSSITFDKSGKPEAWFKIGSSQATQRLQREDDLDISGHRIKVIDIQPRSTLIELNGRLIEIPIGKSVHDALTAIEVTAGGH